MPAHTGAPLCRKLRLIATYGRVALCRPPNRRVTMHAIVPGAIAGARRRATVRVSLRVTAAVVTRVT